MRQMTALDHLRKLLEIEFVYAIVSGRCAYCGRLGLDVHSPDCPWVAAREFVEGADDKPPTVLLDEFFADWQRKCQRGKVSPLDRVEVYILRIFADWLENHG